MADSALSATSAAINAVNYNVVRYNKLMAVTPQLDTTLMTVGYTCGLVHASLSKLSALQISAAAASIASKVAKSDALNPGEAVLITASPTSRLARLEGSTAAIAGMCSDFRMFLRLVCGLPRMYAGGLATWANPPKDAVLKVVAYAQILSILSFQAFESTAYLGMKNVIALPQEKMMRYFKISAKAFLLYVTLEFVKLFRTSQLQGARAVSAGEKEDKVARREESSKWWESAVVNAAWWPLAVHWSTEGFLGEGAIAIGTLIAGNPGLRRAWNSTK